MNVILLTIVTIIYFCLCLGQIQTSHYGFAFMWLGYCIANIGLYFAGATQ